LYLHYATSPAVSFDLPKGQELFERLGDSSFHLIVGIDAIWGWHTMLRSEEPISGERHMRTRTFSLVCWPQIAT